MTALSNCRTTTWSRHLTSQPPPPDHPAHWGDNMQLLTRSLVAAVCFGAASLAAAQPIIHGGGAFACALRADGLVTCWGDDDAGELGNAHFGGLFPTPDTIIFFGPSAIDLASGNDYACMVLADHTVACWGGNSNGQLGIGTTDPSSIPSVIDGVFTATQVAAGAAHSCALLSSGAVLCWGRNNHGQLGNGTLISSSTPANVAISGVVEIAAAGDHTCARRSDGHIWCWGQGSEGELGNGLLSDSATPVPVRGFSRRSAARARRISFLRFAQ
jgi:alpha-tubulin suppressor-like RCC1 family protein